MTGDDEIPASNLVGDDLNIEIDEGEYLRAKATYTDTTGAGKEAIGVSVNSVRAEVNSDNDGVENADNGSPGFPEGLDYTRSVPESTAMEMPVGAMVVAQDPNGDTLSYSLAAFGTTGTANFMDVDFFDIDRATGQINVAKNAGPRSRRWPPCRGHRRGVQGRCHGHRPQRGI